MRAWWIVGTNGLATSTNEEVRIAACIHDQHAVRNERDGQREWAVLIPDSGPTRNVIVPDNSEILHRQ